ncbi:MAG: hypothetical protein DRP13_03205 [Candidatus Aenigmatarchaeota archaeon]|nr:MAG: hypothetical protein DRP13_03205 [Candidatus Aenigmarchaeota archaeon]
MRLLSAKRKRKKNRTVIIRRKKAKRHEELIEELYNFEYKTPFKEIGLELETEKVVYRAKEPRMGKRRPDLLFVFEETKNTEEFKPYAASHDYSFLVVEIKTTPFMLYKSDKQLKEAVLWLKKYWPEFLKNQLNGYVNGFKRLWLWPLVFYKDEIGWPCVKFPSWCSEKMLLAERKY